MSESVGASQPKREKNAVENVPQPVLQEVKESPTSPASASSRSRFSTCTNVLDLSANFSQRLKDNLIFAEAAMRDLRLRADRHREHREDVGDVEEKLGVTEGLRS